MALIVLSLVGRKQGISPISEGSAIWLQRPALSSNAVAVPSRSWEPRLSWFFICVTQCELPQLIPGDSKDERQQEAGIQIGAESPTEAPQEVTEWLGATCVELAKCLLHCFA